jgi:hypothetical protein
LTSSSFTYAASVRTAPLGISDKLTSVQLESSGWAAAPGQAYGASLPSSGAGYAAAQGHGAASLRKAAEHFNVELDAAIEANRWRYERGRLTGGVS